MKTTSKTSKKPGRPEAQPKTELGERLRKARLKAKLEIPAVAERLNVTASTVVRWELGIREPRTATLENLAQIYGTTAGRLIASKRKAPLETLGASKRATANEARA